MSKTALDTFGSILMKRVRDQTIFEWNEIVDGHMKGLTAQQVQEILHEHNTQQIKVLHRLIPQIVDTTLHHVLWMIEQEKALNLTIQIDTDVYSLREISDGLAGELYTDDGWIKRFSKQR